VEQKTVAELKNIDPWETEVMLQQNSLNNTMLLTCTCHFFFSFFFQNLLCSLPAQLLQNKAHLSRVSFYHALTIIGQQVHIDLAILVVAPQ
jgi:hypothetical protein